VAASVGLWRGRASLLATCATRSDGADAFLGVIGQMAAANDQQKAAAAAQAVSPDEKASKLDELKKQQKVVQDDIDALKDLYKDKKKDDTYFDRLKPLQDAYNGSLSLALLTCDAVDLKRRVVALVCAGLRDDIRRLEGAAGAGGGAQGLLLSLLAVLWQPFADSRCLLRGLRSQRYVSEAAHLAREAG